MYIKKDIPESIFLSPLRCDKLENRFPASPRCEDWRGPRRTRWSSETLPKGAVSEVSVILQWIIWALVEQLFFGLVKLGIIIA
jgi:hypothetical protein